MILYFFLLMTLSGQLLAGTKSYEVKLQAYEEIAYEGSSICRMPGTVYSTYFSVECPEFPVIRAAYISTKDGYWVRIKDSDLKISPVGSGTKFVIYGERFTILGGEGITWWYRRLNERCHDTFLTLKIIVSEDH